MLESLEKGRIYPKSCAVKKIGKPSADVLRKRVVSLVANWKAQTQEQRLTRALKIGNSHRGKKIKESTKEKLSKINARLSKEQVMRICALAEAKVKYREIAKIFNIKEPSISDIVLRRSYKWVWLDK